MNDNNEINNNNDSQGQSDFSQLFTVLSSRRRDSRGRITIGATKSDLIEAFNNDEDQVKEEIQKLDEYIKPLGLQILEYYHNENYWYAVGSTVISPNELAEDERIVLGVIITLMETAQDKDDNDTIPYSELERILIDSKYYTNYLLDKHLKNLELLGYIEKKRGNVFSYSARLLLEYPESRRLTISEQSKWLLL